MANIVQRVLKGSPLTLQEHDDNFNNLNAELATKATPASVDTQISTAVTIETNARIAADTAEVTARNTAITTGDTATLVSSKSYTDSNIATEVTNRNTAISNSVTTLKGGVSTDGDTLGKLKALITGTNSGINTGDETASTIKTKLGITAISGINTGDQSLSSLGIPNVENKSSSTIRGEIVSGNITSALGYVPVNPTLIGVANGIASLDVNGLVLPSQLPSYVDDILEYTNQSVFPIIGETGKIYVALDTNKTYRWSGTVYVYITSGAVDSVAGKTGVVTLVKADVGLSSVNNTTDAAKPVSTAQAAAIALKADIASPTLTGVPAAPTAAVGTSTTQLATTAFVSAEIANDATPIAHVGTGATAHAAVTTTVAGFMTAADKVKLDGVAAGATATVGTVTSVTGTAPIFSTGGTTPDITITAATTLLSGSMSASDKLKLDGVTGTNTGDESLATIKSKLGIVTLSGSNTGDETGATIKSKLGIVTLSGVNTGDQTTITGNAGTATKLATARTINGVSFDGTAGININAVDATERIASTEKGAVNGVATLDANGLVPSTQLPSYVDDVLEYANLAAFPVTGEVGKIYVALDTNKTYRWSGTVYVYITSGAVDSVAGKTGVVTLVKADVGLGSVDNTTDAAKPVSTAQQTALNLKANLASPTLTGVPAAPTAAVGTSTTQLATTAFVNAEIASDATPIAHVGTGGTEHAAATTIVAGFMTAADKVKLDGIESGAQANVSTNLTLGTQTGSSTIINSSTGSGVMLPAASTTLAGLLDASDKLKLDGIAAGATVATVTSVAGKTGVVTLVKADVGLGNVDNTTDAAKPVSTAQQTALNLKANLASPTLTGVPAAPTAVVGTSTTQLATTAFVNAEIANDAPSKTGTGASGTWAIAVSGNAGTATKIATARNINGVAFDGSIDITINAIDTTARIASTEKGAPNGVATLDATGLIPSTQLPSYVDDVLEAANLAAFPVTGEAGKIYVALDTNKTYRWSGTVYVYITSGAVDSVAGKTGVVTLVKADVGLGSVDNTTDAAKPVSTAQQTALNLKANLASPTLTGVPAAPTAAVGTSTTQLATTAFVNAEIANDAAPIAHVGTGATAHAAVTTTVAGFMSAADKVKLDGVESGAQANVSTNLTLGTQTGSSAVLNSSTGSGVTLSSATTILAGLLDAADKVKLDGIAAGATVAPVTSVAGKTGVVTLVKADVGLGSVDNTTDAAKPVSTAQATAIALKANIASPTLTGVPAAPTAAVGTSTTQLATTAFVNAEIANDAPSKTGTGASGTWAIAVSGNAATATVLQTARTINGVAFDGSAAITINAVDSTARIASTEKGAVNGVATLDASGLVPSTQLPSYVDDVLEAANLAAFPVTGEVGKIYVALDTNKTYRWSGTVYVYITSGAVDSVAGKTGVVTLVKADVGLGNVDNTSDAAKPVSTAQATAIALKANIASPTLTGVPAAPTAAVGTSTTQLATTAFVNAEIASDATPIAHVGTGATAHAAVTTTVAGFMTAADKVKLDGVATGATAYAHPTGDGNSHIPVTSTTSAGKVLVAGATANSFAWTTLDMTYLPDSAFKKSVRVATTANIGASFVAGIITGPIGVLILDGITVGLNDRILVKDQTASLQNGIYYVSTLGTASVAWILTRSAGANISSEIAGALVNVDSGTQGGYLFDTDFKSTDVLNTTALTWNRILDTGLAGAVVGSTPGTAAIGTSLNYARQDHVHPVQTTITGNAGSATVLQTARTINGVSFNGSAAITINAIDATARIASTEKGAVNGVATLDASGLVPSTQLPSYVDDVLEAANLASFPATGTAGKIYVALDTNKTYRWSGTVYVYITSGAVDSVAGKTGVVTLVKADVGLGNVDNTADSTKSVSYAASAGILNGFTNSNASNPIVGPDSIINNGLGYVNGISLFGVSDGALFTQAYSSAYESQIFQDYRTGQIALRGKNNGTWTGWRTNWDSLNLTNLNQLTNGPGFATGGGTASGTNTGDQVIPTTLPASDVYAWAKAAAKPTYTATEVGLGSVNNTTDAAKPVSTAQATAIALKANIASPTLTGVPAAPTAAVGTSTTQLATTAFVNAEIANDAAPIAHVGTGATAHAAVTTTVAGFMTAADKVKLDAITGSNTGDQTTITGNAGSATKLATARSINGVAFDGSMGITISAAANDVFTWAKQSVKPTYTATEVGLGNVNNTADSTKSVSYASTAGTATSAGSLTGAANVNGTDGWFRSSGAAGWYSTDFAVGIYATETTNVRTYGTGTNFIAGGNVTAYSDERLKKDWAAMPNDFILKLSEIKHGSYTRIDNDVRQVGVSAQELKAILPEAVMGTGEGEDYLSVAYGNAALVAAVELSKEVIQLKAIIADQESRLQRLEALLVK